MSRNRLLHKQSRPHPCSIKLSEVLPCTGTPIHLHSAQPAVVAWGCFELFDKNSLRWNADVMNFRTSGAKSGSAPLSKGGCLVNYLLFLVSFDLLTADSSLRLMSTMLYILLLTTRVQNCRTSICQQSVCTNVMNQWANLWGLRPYCQVLQFDLLEDTLQLDGGQRVDTENFYW